MSNSINLTGLDPKFSSESNGKKYSFSVRFISVDENDPMNGSKRIIKYANNTFIQSFTWVNEINNILLTGEMEYIDTSGDISKFFGSYFSYVHVLLERDISTEGTKTTEQKQRFDHLFLINNYEIIGRQNATIAYRLYLISAHWINYIANVEFSNYDNNDPKNRDIYSIMKNILNFAFTNSDITIDNDSWKKTSNINISFCTTCQTKCMDAIKYLQNRLIYENSSKLDSANSENNNIINGLSFLVFDEFNKSIKLFDLLETPENNITHSDKLGTIVALTGSDVEQFAQFTEQNFKSVVKKSNCQSIISFFDSEMYVYDLTSNTILPKTDKLAATNLNKVGISNNLKSINADSVPIFDFNKFKEFSGLSVVNNNINYKNIGSFDNNDFSIHNDFLENIINRSALILETSGEISHQPGQLFYIADDSDITKSFGDYERELLLDKNRMFTGTFYIFKVRHTFIPGNSEGKAFTERLFISRTHNPKLKSTKSK